MEIFPHVHRIPVPSLTVPPAQHTNSYIVGKKDPVIIDVGSDTAEALDMIITYLRSAYGGGHIRLSGILLTHTHSDHAVGAERLSAMTGAEILVHTEEYENLVDAPARRALTDGEIVRAGDFSLRAIHTPGHSSGHICWYLESEKLLFAGDHIAGEGTVVIAPPEGDMAAYLASLDRLLRLDLTALCPGHGPVIAAPYEKIKEYIDHRLMRERQVLEGLSQGITLIEDLVEAIYTDVPVALHGFAAMSVKAHLIKLEREKKVVVKGEEYSLR